MRDNEVFVWFKKIYMRRKMNLKQRLVSNYRSFFEIKKYGQVTVSNTGVLNRHLHPLHKASLSILKLSHGVCQQGMQPNQK